MLMYSFTTKINLSAKQIINFYGFNDVFNRIHVQLKFNQTKKSWKEESKISANKEPFNVIEEK